MARKFASFADLGNHFYRISKQVQPAIDAELIAFGTVLENRSKAIFGTYQRGWRQLTAETQQRRVAAGYTPNDPLFASGALQGAVRSQVAQGKLFTGVMSGRKHPRAGIDAALLMATHEFGTVDGRVPARPVFGIVRAGIARELHSFALGVAVRVFT